MGFNEAMLARIREAKAMTGDKQYINANTRGTCILKKAIMKQGPKGISAIFELEFETSVGKGPRSFCAEGVPNKPGDHAAVVYAGLDQAGMKGEMGWKNVATAVQAVGQSLQAGQGQPVVPLTPDEQVQLTELLFSDAQPFKGLRLGFDTSVKEPKGSVAGVRSYPYFEAATENKPEQVAARRAALEARGK